MGRPADRIAPGDPWGGAHAAVVAGIDEAGLGPLLGPLTVGFSAFRLVPGEACLWRRLEGAVSADPARDRERLVVADSKRVFTRNSRGRRRLERAVLGFLAQLGPAPDSGRALLAGSGPDRPSGAGLLTAEPWCGALAPRLPLWSEPGRLELDRARLARALALAGVEPLAAGVRAVSTGELNRELVRTNNKAVAHWGWVSEVLLHLWERFAGEGLSLVTDRQGGRFRYGALLGALFPGARVVAREESPRCSEYLVVEPRGERRMRLAFAERAEQSSLPVALASCLAKYAREVCMEAFNAHFSALQPGLRPTAGYTSDGRRWMLEAAPALTRAGLAPESLLRAR